MSQYKILLLGATGMLGSDVVKTFADDSLFSVTATHRHSPWAAWSIFRRRPRNIHFIIYDCKTDDYKNIGANYDYIINCIGSINPTYESPEEYYVNSTFPHDMSDWAESRGAKLIHISSDGVFSGQRAGGRYTELDQCDDITLYGKSKSLGEPKNAMVLRTSVISEDKFTNRGLISWVKSHRGGVVNGYINHLWNGMTGTQYGLACKKIILDGLYENEIFHTFSPEVISKFDLIKLINDKYNLNIDVRPTESGASINRSLDTLKKLNKALEIPTIQEQIRMID